MTKPKKPESNLIEEAIGDRAKTPKPIPQNPSEIPDEPTPSEMLTLEELNRRTEKRLQDPYQGENLTREEKRILNQTKPTTPVSKLGLQPVTKTSSQESPPQEIEKTKNTPPITLASVEEAHRRQEKFNVEILPKTPAEDVELTALKKYILEDGFVESAIAFHIVTLCSQPLVITPTTAWAFKDRAKIPEMVLALLNQPGYIEGVWPSLKIIMSSNAGNSAWSAGVLMTIALFDIVRTLPALKELQNDS